MTITNNSYLQTYDFDDLLVNLSKEVISKGIESDSIPSTIKDWLCGKIVRALPKELTEKILTYLLDNRELSDHISYKQSNLANHEEITLILYSSAKMKRKREEDVRLSSIKKSKNFLGESNSLDHQIENASEKENSRLRAHPHAPTEVSGQQNFNSIFNNNSEDLNNNKELTKMAQNFFSEEMIVHSEPKTFVGMGPAGANLARHGVKRARGGHMSGFVSIDGNQLNCNISTNDYIRTVNSDTSEEDFNDDNHALAVNDDHDGFDLSDRINLDSPSIERQIKKALRNSKGPPDKNSRTGRKLTNGLPNLTTNGSGHQELDKITTLSALGKSIDPANLPKGTTLLDTFRLPDSQNQYSCYLCQNDITYSGKYSFNAHLKQKHDDYWETNKSQFINVKVLFADEAERMEEITQDPDSTRYTCKVCGKQWDKARSVVQHVKRIHRGEIEGICKYCNKEFTNYANWRMHELTHTDTYTHICEYCGKGVRKMQKLKEHKKVHHKELYEIELREAAEKQLTEEAEVARKLKSGELQLQQKVSLNEIEISDIVDRVVLDGGKAEEGCSIDSFITIGMGENTLQFLNKK